MAIIESYNGQIPEIIARNYDQDRDKIQVTNNTVTRTLLWKVENHKAEFSKGRKAHKVKKLTRPKNRCGWTLFFGHILSFKQ